MGETLLLLILALIPISNVEYVFISQAPYTLGCISPNKQSSSVDGYKLIQSDTQGQTMKLHASDSAQVRYSRLTETSSGSSSRTSLQSSIEGNDKENNPRDNICEVGSGRVRPIANENLTGKISSGGVKRKHSESDISVTVCYFYSRKLKIFET